jgi:hypothetical protein
VTSFVVIIAKKYKSNKENEVFFDFGEMVNVLCESRKAKNNFLSHTILGTEIPTNSGYVFLSKYEC